MDLPAMAVVGIVLGLAVASTVSILWMSMRGRAHSSGNIRNDRDIAIGDLIGSSVYNIAIIGVTGLAALPEGVQLSSTLVTVDLPVMPKPARRSVCLAV